MSNLAEANMDKQTSDEKGDTPSASRERTIFILAPTGQDAAIAGQFLTNAGFRVEACGTMDEMRHNLREGCGAVILAEEALSTEAAAGFLKALECQPSWSDIPVTIITGGDEATQRRLRRRISSEASSNVMLLGRPFHPETFISTMDVALRSRMRQYQVRDLLLNQRTNEQKMQGILESISDAFADRKSVV